MTGPDPIDTPPTRDEMLELEHQGWQSLCNSTGSEFYGSVMTEDALMVLAHGVAMDRTEVRASLRHAPPWASYEITGARVVPIGAAAAALVYTGRARRDDGQTFTALMASTYVRVDGAPRLALYQQTVVPE